MDLHARLAVVMASPFVRPETSVSRDIPLLKMDLHARLAAERLSRYARGEAPVKRA